MASLTAQRSMPVVARMRPAPPRQASLRALTARSGARVEAVLTVLVLFVTSEALIPLIMHGGADLPDLNPATTIERVSFWIGYLFTAAMLLRYHRGILLAVGSNPLIPCVAVLALLSTLWSDDPATSARTAFTPIMATAFGLYLAARYDARALLRLLAIALAGTVVISLLLGVLIPAYGVSHGVNEGAWRGAFTQKNRLGQTMALACIVFWFRAQQSQRRWLWAGCGIAALGLLLLSRSASSIAVLGAVGLLMPACVALRRGGFLGKSIICALLAGAAVLTVLIVDREQVLGAFGKDVTLTGRTELWAAVVHRIMDRPLLGYGFSAFWSRAAGPAEAIRAQIGWDAPHAHNGYLDLWLDIGLVGLLVFVTGYLFAVRRAWGALSRDASLYGKWAVAFLVMLALSNLTESSIDHSRLIWEVFVATAAMQPLLSRRHIAAAVRRGSPR